MSNDLSNVDPKFLPAENKELNTDFNYSRKNLYQLIETAMAGIEDFVPVAQQSQNARAYEVLFNAIKTAAELNEKLADHSVKKEETTKEEPRTKHGDVINQTLITTADLAQIVEKALTKENKDE